MTSTVPSVEDFTNAFPNHLTPLAGEPTYQTLKELKDQLKANAASIPTTLGGGHHGYLGLILSPAAYATISPTAFAEPAYPGQHPTIPAGTNAANTSAIIRRHTEDTRQWREFKNVSTALKNQLLSAVDDIYVRALRDRHVGYMNQTIRNILTHLFNNYGNITQLELEDNDTKMRTLWDPNSPFDCLVQQLEDGQDYADDGGQPYTTDQLLRIAYTLVFKTGLYFEDCKAWNAKPNNEKTWSNFKEHFQRAQRLLRDQLRTTKQAGFTSNLAMHNQIHHSQPPPEYRDALVNLATSAAADRELLTKLATTVASIHQSPASPTTMQPRPLPSPRSPAPSLTSNNKSPTSSEKTTNYANSNPDAHELDVTMATIVGHMAIGLATSTQVPPAKTKPLATKTMPPVKTPWAAVRPTNPSPPDREGGVYPQPNLK